MKIYLAQIKPFLGKVQENLDIISQIIEEQIAVGTDIVVFPELSLTVYLLEDMVYDVAIKTIPQKLLDYSKNISIIFGAVELGEDLYHYNTAYYLEDGEVKHKHRKVYLPTYGLFDEARYFKAGNRINAFDTKFGRIGMLVCEDIFHQSSSYILGEDGVEILFTLVNSPSRLGKNGLEIAEIWSSLCRASSISNSNFTVMVNRVGIEDGVNFWGGSFVISPTGEIIQQLNFFETDGEIVEIDKREIKKARFVSSTKDEKQDLVLKELHRIQKRRLS